MTTHDAQPALYEQRKTGRLVLHARVWRCLRMLADAPPPDRVVQLRSRHYAVLVRRSWRLKVGPKHPGPAPDPSTVTLTFGDLRLEPWQGQH
jgi:hypothetical protein